MIDILNTILEYLRSHLLLHLIEISKVIKFILRNAFNLLNLACGNSLLYIDIFLSELINNLFLVTIHIECTIIKRE